MTLGGLPASACSHARREWDEPASVDLRLRAWRWSACSFPCRRSLALARSLFHAQSSSGFLSAFLPFPPHLMSGELVKTARADRSSVKPLQFIPIPFRPRIGCRMMCSLAACLLRHVPPSSCLPLPNSLRSTASLTHLAPRPVARVVPLFAIRRLVSSAHLVCFRFARPPRSAYPPRLSCRRAGRLASRSHLVMRLACRLCVSLVLFSVCLPLY